MLSSVKEPKDLLEEIKTQIFHYNICFTTTLNQGKDSKSTINFSFILNISGILKGL